MNSSISSSEPGDPWRRFFALLLACGAGLGLAVYLLLVIIDPFDMLPLSPPLDRAPIATNARFSFPALARSQRFDSAIFGTSTSRELQPRVLDPLFGARFVNLAMNSATAYEQFRLMGLFAMHHRDAKNVIVGIDAVWCESARTIEKFTPRPFPEWMYGGSRWRGFGHLFDLYTMEQAGRQLAVLTGLRPAPYGRDGYTDFLPSDSQYDLARARMHLRGGSIGPDPAIAGEAEPQVDAAEPSDLPGLPLLSEALSALPAVTRKLVYVVPYHISGQPAAGSPQLERWRACKAALARIVAAIPGAVGVDFMLPSPITREDANYWDRLHYRVGIGVRIARDLAKASEGRFSDDDPDFATLK